METVLVTGANGFIGRYVCDLLRQQYHMHVHAFDSDLLRTDLDGYLAAIKPAYLVNLAWITGPGYTDSDKNLLFAAKGLELYEAFFRHGGKRCFYAGTEQEYTCSDSPLVESSPLGPRTLYAECKANLGKILLRDSTLKARGVIWGRIFFVYGAGEKSARLMPSLITSLQNGDTAICSNGALVRDYIYVKDLAGAICHCLYSDFSGAVNLCGGRDTTIQEIGSTLHQLIGKGSVHYKTLEESGPQPLYLRGDITLLESLGWKHKYTLKTGLEEEISMRTEGAQ